MRGGGARPTRHGVAVGGAALSDALLDGGGARRRRRHRLAARREPRRGRGTAALCVPLLAHREQREDHDERVALDGHHVAAVRVHQLHQLAEQAAELRRPPAQVGPVKVARLAAVSVRAERVQLRQRGEAGDVQDAHGPVEVEGPVR